MPDKARARENLRDLSWKPEDAEASLRIVHDYVIAETEKQIGWYDNKKASKAKMSRTLRLCAIILTIIAGLIPALISIGAFGGLDPRGYIQLTYLFLGLAAGCMGLDKYFGFSTAWMRKITTQMALERALTEFRVDWVRSIAELGGQRPDATQIQGLLSLAGDLLDSVHDRLEEETAAWVAEFETNLTKLQRDAETQLRAAKSTRAGGSGG